MPAVAGSTKHRPSTTTTCRSRQLARTVRVFCPQPVSDEVPLRVPSPFDVDAPHPIALRAARELQTLLPASPGAAATISAPPSGALASLWGPDGGKMFGVLVVADGSGQLGYLSAFSGMLNRAWHVEGFSPPLFDLAERDSFWIDGENTLAAVAARLTEAERSAESIRLEMEALARVHSAEREALSAEHQVRRQARKRLRATLSAAPDEGLPQRRTAALLALDQESRGDEAAKRSLKATHRDALAAAQVHYDQARTSAAAIADERSRLSRTLLRRIRDTYTVRNALGAHKPLHEIFTEIEPPGGAGDCAGPKLLGEAYRRGLRPVAFAEFWWGAAPPNGDRKSGSFYPACRGKCGPVLGHMLEGVEVTPPRMIGAAPDRDAPLSIVYEDAFLVVIDKPACLLSVPGRHARLKDSVQSRMAARYPDASGPLIVHRLDAEVTGLMVVAKTKDAHAALQLSFARRLVDKRYLAWLEGVVADEEGTIELPLRGNVDDRPRQIVDLQHGKYAHTSWRVVARDAARTLVELRPHTGRTHQLRVHAAHPAGLGHPIIGDRLYGTAGPALLLRAHSLRLPHPAGPAHPELIVSASPSAAFSAGLGETKKQRSA